MATTMVPESSARPDVLPSDRLLANGMAIPDIRPSLRRIDNVRNAITVVSVWFYVVLLVGGAVWLDTLVELPDRLRAHGTDVRPLRHLDARVGPQAPLHQQAVERLDRHLDHRLPRLHPRAALPPRPLRPPPGRVRPGRARHGLLRPVPLHQGRAATTAVPRCGRHLGLEELRPARQGHPEQAVPAASGSRSSVSKQCCGPCPGWPPDGGGSTRCCGGCRG